MSDQTVKKGKIGSTLPAVQEEVSEEAKKALQKAKINIIMKYPFLGYLVMGSRYQFTEEVPTAAATTIQGNRIFINEEFFLNLKNDAQRAFVLLHEVFHIFFEHIDRRIRNNYNADLYNIASDYFINIHLHNLSGKLLEVPGQAVLDTSNRFYRDDGSLMSSDEIYQKLLEENNGSIKKALEQFGDVKEVWVDGGDGQAPMDELPDHETPEEVQAENKQTMNSAAQQASQKDMGEGAGGLLEAMNELLDSTVPWNELLSDYVESENNRQDFTYNRPSRRNTGNIIFPTTFSEYLKVFIGIDSSGSMLFDDDLHRCISEIQGIMDNFEEWLIEFWTCDEEAFQIARFSSEEGDEKSDVLNVSVHGGGGTEISSLVRAANESEEGHNVAVILSDFMIPEQPFQEELDNSDVSVFCLISPNGVSEKELSLTNTTIAKMD